MAKSQLCTVGGDNMCQRNLGKHNYDSVAEDLGMSPMRQTLEVQAEGKLNALTTTTTVIRFACLGMYPTCALASPTDTSVVAEGGCKGYQS